MPAQSSASSLSERFPVDCDAHTLGQGLRASDCMKAIDSLPTDHPGDVHMDLERARMIYPEFSRNAPEDRHRLPISEEVATCGVSVGLMSPSYDYSSGRIIRLRIMDIVRDCVKFGGAEIGGGGYTVTGQQKRLQLILYFKSDNDAASTGVSLFISNNTIAVVR